MSVAAGVGTVRYEETVIVTDTSTGDHDQCLQAPLVVTSVLTDQRPEHLVAANEGLHRYPFIDSVEQLKVIEAR